MSDSFFHKEAKIKQFLIDEPEELKRYPKQVHPLTYYRPKDVLSLEVNGKYLAAYVCNIHATSPVVAFYDLIFEHRPLLDQLIDQRAYGTSYPKSETPDVKYFEKYSIKGMTYMPDPAEQITIIASAVNLELDKTGLHESMALSTDIELDDVLEIFNNIDSR